jgi:MinD-like ATPase involved in chromosome partitioning or flagellar assembly/DNA-binding response OmpR family regulator
MQDRKNVLIIDSDINLIEDLQRRFLLEPNYEILGVAYSGSDGYELCRQGRADFAIIAHPLPDCDTLQLIDGLNKAFPGIKKIVTLETEDPMFTARCMQLGVRDILVKPYSIDKLIEIMNDISNKPSAEGFNQPFQDLGQQYAFGGFQPGFGQQPSPAQHRGPSIEEMRNAMSQYEKLQAEQQSQSSQPFQNFNFGQGSTQNSTPQGGGQNFQFGQQGQFGFNAGQSQGFTSNPQHQQQGFYSGQQPPSQGQQGFGQNQPGYGQGGFDLNYGQSFSPGKYGVQQPFQEQGNQGGGFRTLKQKIIAVNCPKGGVGKTSISKELAVAYSMVRINGQPLKVCLVDGDLDFGDVCSTLNINAYPNISHWSQDIAQRLKNNPNADIRYPQDYIEQKFLITYPGTGLKVLAAPNNHSDALDITGRHIEIILENLRNCDFDVIVIDTGNNTKDYTLISLDKAHVVLMVVTLDLTCINDAHLLLSTLRSIQFPTSKIQLVINRMPKTDKDIEIAEISQALHTQIIGVVPEFPKIRQLNNNGTPAVMGKENEFTAAVRKIGNQILPVFNRIVHVKKGKNQPNKGQSKGGLFGKLFQK